MKHKLSATLGFIIFVLVGLVSSTVRAQTTAVGPYYASPSWDQTLPSSTRFIVLSNMNSEAVLDRETGLVWERSPMTSTFTWSDAPFVCTFRTTGGRKGWRLPSVHELASLVDPSVASPGPTLPTGHPFINVQSSFYWSATTLASDSSFAWGVRFSNRDVNVGGKGNSTFVWCVRGAMNADQY